MKLHNNIRSLYRLTKIPWNKRHTIICVQALDCLFCVLVCLFAFSCCLSQQCMISIKTINISDSRVSNQLGNYDKACRLTRMHFPCSPVANRSILVLLVCVLIVSVVIFLMKGFTLRKAMLCPAEDTRPTVIPRICAFVTQILIGWK